MPAGKTPEAGLTAAEERVIRLVSQSKTNREIASTLGISPATVKRHLENILRKLRVRNRVEAAIYSLMSECDGGNNNAECPLAAWRKRHQSRQNGPIDR
ncbi:MAG TPA: LuxR C-terminal-related transcriptional regulator [Phototrophicaceae bacterium]|jgi:DNA-binding CsgD family transcriptional regulator|nr:LuxR C-terminal-related transcriptional regulator [Phototrophicaceae bacterium]